MNDLDFCVTAATREVGYVRLDVEGKLRFPRLDESPGIYRFLITTSGDTTTAYVGETDRLRRRLQHYRTPGRSQTTNIRLNARMRKVLEEGGTVNVAVIETATGSTGVLDLSEQTARVLVESAWLLSLKAEGIPVENA